MRAMLLSTLIVLSAVATACDGQPRDGGAAQQPEPSSATTDSSGDVEATQDPPVGSNTADGVPRQRALPLPRLERLPSQVVALGAGGAPAALARTEDAVWVQSHRGTVLTRLDAESGAVDATTDVGLLGCGDLVADAGTVWLTGCEVTPGLVGVGASDAKVVATTYVTGLGPALLDGELWVARTFSGATDLRRIDVASVDEGDVVPVPGLLDGEGGVVAAGGSIWTVDKSGGVVYQVDPASEQVVAAIPMPVPPDAGYLIEHDGAAWYTDPSLGVLVRIDPDTGEPHLSRVRTEKPREYWGVAASTAPGPAGRLWVRSGDEAWLVDTRRDRVLRRIALRPGRGGDLLQVGDTLWAAAFARDQVERIPLS